VVNLKPDVLLLDLKMPGLNGLEVLRVLGQRSSRTRVVIFSAYGSEGFVLEALENGAAGFLLKSCKPEEIMAAVRAAAAGRSYLSAPFTARALRSYKEKMESTRLDPHETLTPREREVLQLAAEGHTSAEIGSRLFLSERTVEKHRSNVMHKLGLKSYAELIRYAVRRGIMPPE